MSKVKVSTIKGGSMGGYCTFGYRTKEGVIKSGVVYTGYLKQMMLSFPVMGFDLIDKVLQEEPEGYGAEAMQKYRDRADQRPVMIYYGLVFVDEVTNRVHSFQSYTSPNYESMISLSQAFEDPEFSITRKTLRL